MKINFISTLTATYDFPSIITTMHEGCGECKFIGTIKTTKTCFGVEKVDLYVLPYNYTYVIYGNGISDFYLYHTKHLPQDSTKRGKIVSKAITTTPEWNAPLIKERLLRSDKWVTEGIVRIYEYQTAEEQNSDATLEDNGVGFNGVDAELLSSFARQISQNGTLSTKQMPYARNKLLKYSGQLAKIANTKTQIEKRKAA